MWITSRFGQQKTLRMFFLLFHKMPVRQYKILTCRSLYQHLMPRKHRINTLLPKPCVLETQRFPTHEYHWMNNLFFSSQLSFHFPCKESGFMRNFLNVSWKFQTSVWEFFFLPQVKIIFLAEYVKELCDDQYYTWWKDNSYRNKVVYIHPSQNDAA